MFTNVRGRDDAYESRYGGNISGFAPGTRVSVISSGGVTGTNSGTSFSASYVAGGFAVACETTGGLCQNNTGSAASLYQALRDISPTGGVVENEYNDWHSIYIYPTTMVKRDLYFV